MSSAVAGAIVVLAPGSAVLALLGIGAAQGRRAGAAFIFGHLAGDLMWSTLAPVALVGARILAPWVFNALATFCGLFLFWLSARAVCVRRTQAEGPEVVVRRPLLRGLAGRHGAAAPALSPPRALAGTRHGPAVHRFAVNTLLHAWQGWQAEARR